MGMRPMMGFNDAGITVYFENQTPNVGEVAKLVAAQKARVVWPEGKDSSASSRSSPSSSPSP